MKYPFENLFSKKRSDKMDQEHVAYTLAFEKALRSLEAEAHESDDPNYIITHALKSACDFYGADWSGFLDVDLDLKLWTPSMWYNASPEDKTTVLIQEYESAEFLDRWITALHNSQPVFIPDVEALKADCPRNTSYTTEWESVPFWLFLSSHAQWAFSLFAIRPNTETAAACCRCWRSLCWLSATRKDC